MKAVVLSIFFFFSAKAVVAQTENVEQGSEMNVSETEQLFTVVDSVETVSVIEPVFNTETDKSQLSQKEKNASKVVLIFGAAIGSTATFCFIIGRAVMKEVGNWKFKRGW